MKGSQGLYKCDVDDKTKGLLQKRNQPALGQWTLILHAARLGGVYCARSTTAWLEMRTEPATNLMLVVHICFWVYSNKLLLARGPE